MEYRIYQDGEINFTIQAPDNKTIAIFSIKNQENNYHSIITDLRTPKIITQVLENNLEKRDAIISAYNNAKDFAKSLSPDYEDRTELKNKLKKTYSPYSLESNYQDFT
jgi:hypothetical protein